MVEVVVGVKGGYSERILGDVRFIHPAVLAGDALKLVGPKMLSKDVSHWMDIGAFADVVLDSEI